MSFGSKILEYKEELLKDLDELIRIESVSSESPEKCTEALNWMLNKAEGFGLITKNIDNKAGHAQLGDGGLLCATLTHLDVVPASSGWDTNPFELTRKDGRLFGRGVADDKGAALVTLYCLRILKECGVEGKNTLRAIFGTDEEVGMTDVAAYFGKEAMPDMSFTPDADYGICRAEKGILQLELTCKRGDAAVLTELKGGTVVNAVADTAYAVINCSESDDHQLMRLADAKDGEFEFMYTPDGMMIKSKGKAAHACEPQKGHNAILDLIDLLSANFTLSSLGNLCSFLSTRIRMESDGTSLGMKMRDSQSGALTVCASTIEINETTERATLDIRYPVTFGGKELIRRVKKAADFENVEVNVLSHSKPLYLDDSRPVIGILKEAYEEIMSEAPEMYATGGGTYARKLGGNGVAFGPVFKGDPSNLHTDNEGIDEENFMKHAQICLEAMYRMFTAE
ncbi:MAG: Sapep family Mn(2+)-dependent dipeptidase [Ruminococcus sp.]|nr:Sapep family Mn(2+)-dependent dipeptidase [Ruminococcus sp.]